MNNLIVDNVLPMFLYEFVVVQELSKLSVSEIVDEIHSQDLSIILMELFIIHTPEIKLCSYLVNINKIVII